MSERLSIITTSNLQRYTEKISQKITQRLSIIQDDIEDLKETSLLQTGAINDLQQNKASHSEVIDLLNKKIRTVYDIPQDVSINDYLFEIQGGN